MANKKKPARESIHTRAGKTRSTVKSSTANNSSISRKRKQKAPLNGQIEILPIDQSSRPLGANDVEVDFEKIKGRAYPVLAKILQHWYSDGQLNGNEFEIGDVEGSSGSSLKFNIEKGVGADFNGGGWEGGDIISLNAAYRSAATGRAWTMKEAAFDLQQLLEKWEIEPPKPGAVKVTVDQYRPLVPVTKENEINWDWFFNQKWVRKHIPKDQLDPNCVRKWEYRDANGFLMQYVIRWEENGGKQIRAVTFDQDKWEWRFKHIPAPRPLYGLDRLAARLEAPILLVEGEKAADCPAAAMLFPDHIAMTWCGGAKNVKEADWTPLSGRDVLVWPDADQPGRDAMQVVVDQLQTVGAASVKMILCPDGVPEGWDLADPVPEGLDLFSWLVAKRSEPNSAPAPAASGIVKATDKETLLVALRRMNETHFVGRENGRTYVYNIEEDVLFRQKRTKLTMSSFQDHKNFYLNRLYAIDDEDKFVSLGGEWLRSKERREYRGITLDPKETPDGYYNLWRGFAVQPEEGSWEPFKEHMFENLCRANQQYYDYLIRWCARLFQHPDEPGQVAVVIGGEEGAGKGFFARALGHLLGQHFIHISSQSHLVGKFNAHQRDAILMFADESFWAGDIQGANALKRLITEPTLMIEAKGKDSIQVPNMIHLILASNNDWIVPARWGARRFFVLRIGEKRLNDKPWFAKVNGQLKATGYAGFLHEMLNMDLVKYQVEEVLQTEWLLKQKQFTMESHEAWFLHKLESGNLLATGNAKSGVTGDWLAEEVVVETTDLHADYLDAMKRLQERYPKAENVFGMFLYDLFRPWSEKVGKEEWPIKKRDKKERKTFYRFPKLADCRKAFEMYTKVSKWEWPKDEEMAM